MARTKLTRKKFKYPPPRAYYGPLLTLVYAATNTVARFAKRDEKAIDKSIKKAIANMSERKRLTPEEKRQRKKLQNAKRYNTPAKREKRRQQRKLKREQGGAAYKLQEATRQKKYYNSEKGEEYRRRPEVIERRRNYMKEYNSNF